MSLSCAFASKGQTPDGESVPINNFTTSVSDGKMFISMDIDVSRLKVRSNREMTFTPRLSGYSDSLELPSVMLAGRNRWWHHIRNNSIPEGTELFRASETACIEYRKTIPYDKWMDRSSFRLESLTGGCCGEAIERKDTLLAVICAPKSFVPKFIYVRPEARPKVLAVSGSAYIDFPVNMTDIYPDYRRNAEELDRITRTIDAIRNDSDANILSVHIKGHASPEGPYKNNIRLATERTSTLKNYVKDLYDFPDTLVTTSCIPEDWEGLEMFVANSGLAHRDAILEIIRGGLEPDAKEWKIKSSYPADYSYLYNTIYPALRHSDYKVEYSVCEYTDTTEIIRLLKTEPQKLSLNEMYIASGSMEAGSEEYNEVFGIAVRMFPEDKVANLNAANSAMGIGDMRHAARYLEKAGDSPEACYARGVFAAMSEDYDTARSLFRKALEEGLVEAEDAIRQIDGM